MKKLTLLLAAALFFLSGCQGSITDQTDASTPMPPPISPDASLPVPSLSPIPTTSEPEPSQDGILYRPVIVDGVTEIRQKEGEGIELDLNGDGIVKQLYTCEEGIFINGIKQELNLKWSYIDYYATHSPYLQDWQIYWIVDVDRSDGYYNLIFGSTPETDLETLTYYDGTLKKIAEAEQFLYFSADPGYSKASYRGDGTYLMTGCVGDIMGHIYPTEIEYCLSEDEETGNIVQKQISEFLPILSEPMPEMPLTLLDNITMYTKPDLESVSFIAEPQLIFATAASDCWVQVLLADHTTEAWIYVEQVWNEEDGYMMHVIDHEKDAREIFSGFSNAG